MDLVFAAAGRTGSGGAGVDVGDGGADELRVGVDVVSGVIGSERDVESPHPAAAADTVTVSRMPVTRLPNRSFIGLTVYV
jgi:hypothetical protein